MRDRIRAILTGGAWVFGTGVCLVGFGVARIVSHHRWPPKDLSYWVGKSYVEYMTQISEPARTVALDSERTVMIWEVPLPDRVCERSLIAQHGRIVGWSTTGCQ